MALDEHIGWTNNSGVFRLVAVIDGESKANFHRCLCVNLDASRALLNWELNLPTASIAHSLPRIVETLNARRLYLQVDPNSNAIPCKRMCEIFAAVELPITDSLT